MYTWLLPYLICPNCLPKEIILSLDTVTDIEDQDILSGQLICPKCRSRYLIKEGVALLTIDTKTAQADQDKYEQDKVLSSYLWSHFSDHLFEPWAEPLFPRLAESLTPSFDMALDCGCAVGRFTFELGMRGVQSVGVDLSTSFIKAARHLAKYGQTDFDLPVEGDLCEHRELEIPSRYLQGNIDFLVADAMALPFVSGCFDALGSVNVLDKIINPLQHLLELNRLGDGSRAELLISDPFSWSQDWTPRENWLGGKDEGQFSGLGKDNIKWLIQGNGGYFKPFWRVRLEDSIWWRLRSHINHYELIRSWFVLAERM
ncbi:MAG TPA: methyltransferase domain-containing protein [Desulfohalobiaceae bacterium]|nr:methyltransferase domain-containing protein [Desulfohalobiaceae bacterium]